MVIIISSLQFRIVYFLLQMLSANYEITDSPKLIIAYNPYC